MRCRNVRPEKPVTVELGENRYSVKFTSGREVFALFIALSAALRVLTILTAWPMAVTVEAMPAGSMGIKN